MNNSWIILSLIFFLNSWCNSKKVPDHKGDGIKPLDNLPNSHIQIIASSSPILTNDIGDFFRSTTPFAIAPNENVKGYSTNYPEVSEETTGKTTTEKTTTTDKTVNKATVESGSEDNNTSVSTTPSENFTTPREPLPNIEIPDLNNESSAVDFNGTTNSSYLNSSDDSSDSNGITSSYNFNISSTPPGLNSTNPTRNSSGTTTWNPNDIQDDGIFNLTTVISTTTTTTTASTAATSVPKATEGKTHITSTPRESTTFRATPVLSKTLRLSADRKLERMFTRVYKGIGHGAVEQKDNTCNYDGRFPKFPTRLLVLKVALNENQFMESYSCGMCVELTRQSFLGFGQDNMKTIAFVDGVCKECAKGDVRFTASNETYPVSIKAVPCPVGRASVMFEKRGSSPYFFQMQVANFRYPVTRIEIQTRFREWQKLSHTNDGFFVLESKVFLAPPINVRVFAYNSMKIGWIIDSSESSKTVSTGQQFPEYLTETNTLTTQAPTPSNTTRRFIDPSWLRGRPPLLLDLDFEVNNEVDNGNEENNETDNDNEGNMVEINKEQNNVNDVPQPKVSDSEENTEANANVKLELGSLNNGVMSVYRICGAMGTNMLFISLAMIALLSLLV